jgi:hypothetical protein
VFHRDINVTDGVVITQAVPASARCDVRRKLHPVRCYPNPKSVAINHDAGELLEKLPRRAGRCCYGARTTVVRKADCINMTRKRSGRFFRTKFCDFAAIDFAPDLENPSRLPACRLLAFKTKFWVAMVKVLKKAIGLRGEVRNGGKVWRGLAAGLEG